MVCKSIIEEIPTLARYCNGGKSCILDRSVIFKNYENNLPEAYISLLQKEQTIDLERVSQSMFGKSIIEEITTLASYCNGGKIEDGKILYFGIFKDYENNLSEAYITLLPKEQTIDL